MERCIELFAIFGGLDVQIDTTQHIQSLLIDHVLKRFGEIEDGIKRLVGEDKNAFKLLRSLAKGDRRIFSSFKKAHLNNQNGGIALGLLEQNGLVKIEHSREQDKRKIKPKLSKEEAKHRISDKFLIVYPFLRFWFYFIYPHRKEIEKGEFGSCLEEFERKRFCYTSLVFEELSRILLSYYLRDEIIESVDSYWDADIEVDILIETKKHHIYAAECKWTNHKINKKELNKLHQKCTSIGIRPKRLIFFSKRGFSKELESVAGKYLLLFSVEDFAQLVKTKPVQPIFPLSFAC